MTDKMELSAHSHNRSTLHHSDKDFATTEDVAESGGSIHGSEIDLVPSNGIMVKHEYHVTVEDKGSRRLPEP